MKTAISTFITEHPFLSFLLADAIVAKTCKMVAVAVRGWPEVKEDKTEPVMVEVEEATD